MKFCWSTLTVKNLDESVKFYQDIIGLSLNNRFKAGNAEIAFLGDDETKVELIKVENKDFIETGKDISWGFETESLDIFIEKLKASGVEDIPNIISPTPHIKFIMIEDPNGMKLQIVEKN